MKYISLIFFAAVVLVGCAQEAYYTDHEYGLATTDAFDRQIVHKDYLYADKTGDGMDGIHAEPIMQTYQNSFSEGFTMESIDTSSPGSSMSN